MKTLIHVAALSISICASTITGYAQERRTSNPRLPSPSTVVLDPALVPEFVSREGNFAIKFPRQPTEDDAFQLPSGRTYTVRTDNARYIVSYIELARRPPDEAELRRGYDRARDEGLARSRTRLISERDVRQQGHLGREIFAEGNGVLIKSRAFLVGTRFYQIIVVTNDYRNGNASVVRFNESLISEFLQSFRFLTR